MSNQVFRTLSKSDFKAACECPTKLYYREMHYPSTKESDDYLHMLAEGGYMVETVAKLMHPAGLTMEYGGDAVENARATREALEADKVTLFEATLLSGRKLARADILEKDGNTFRLIEIKAKGFNSDENAERLAEGIGNFFRGKRKPHPISSDWLPYLEDIAFQVLVLREMFPDAKVEPYLCLVDKSRRTTMDGLPKWFHIERKTNRAGKKTVHRAYYNGDVEKLCAERLVAKVSVADEVAEIIADVEAKAEEFEASLIPELQKLRPEPHLDCGKCEYRFKEPAELHGFAECWGDYANVRPSVLDLYHASGIAGTNGPLLNEMIASGKVSLLDISEDVCVKKNGSVGPVATRQRIQLCNTRDNTVWTGPALTAALESARYPLHFIDFEAARLALPAHHRMRPYGQIAFQWSCHTQASRGAPLVHSEWLNDRDYWPNADFARSLRRQIGDEGTVLTWSPFEGSTLKEFAREQGEFEEEDQGLAEWIKQLTESGRILDLNKVALDGYFHPGMGGRTSIKVVLDAIWATDPEMRAQFEELTGAAADVTRGPYAALPPVVINGVEQSVVEGTGAVRAYQAMMYGVERDDEEAHAEWRKALLQYCALDTFAMVLIWDHWARRTIS